MINILNHYPRLIYLMLGLLLTGCGSGEQYSANPLTQQAYNGGVQDLRNEYISFKQGQFQEIVSNQIQVAYEQGYSGNSCGEYNTGVVACRLHRLERPVRYPNVTPREYAEYQIALAFNNGVRNYVAYRQGQAIQDARECGEAIFGCVRRPESAKFLKAVIIN
jgi:hypothetical protein